MTTTAGTMPPAVGSTRRAAIVARAAALAPSGAPADALDPILNGEEAREKFIPVTRQALMERLTRSYAWPAGEGSTARRFFRYLDYWRRQRYNARLQALEHTYETFSPDSDLLITRRFSETEKAVLQRRLVGQVCELLEQANYTRIPPESMTLVLTPDSHYGLNLEVDLKAFDELVVFYRGASSRTETRRSLRKLFLRHEEFDVPIFQRLCILFKLKPEEQRISELMAEKGCDREAAEKHYRKARDLLPPQIKTEFVYVKLFKNIPRTDLEMVFPNTRVRFRGFDKVKLGVTTGSSVGMGVVGAVGKVAVATNPVALAGVAVGLGGIAIRQAMSFINQKNRYMVTMAQNLYFHAMADNRGVMTLLADRAAEEDVKEEMLLYAVLAKEHVTRADLPDVDGAIEQFMLNTFGVAVDFDVDDALSRLIEDGIVTERPDGRLEALPPEAAARHVDMLWDKYLDELPDITVTEGVEFDFEPDEPLRRRGMDADRGQGA